VKKILITGVNSYVGKSLVRWLEKFPGEYQIESISLRNDEWRTRSFAGYNIVIHVAGIAHVSSDPKLEDQYYQVNRDLTIETARKAKVEGVGQFIFLSSIIVYGNSSSCNRIITKNTIPEPSNFYGKSKLQAEEGIKPLEDGSFKVVILRPPMVYGRGSKGNYIKLSKIAQSTPIFPDINNRRSMIHIDNLCEFIRLLIDKNESGLFFPQNTEYIKTSEMVKLIAEVHGKKVRFTKVFNPLIKLMGLKLGVTNKVFGNLIYEKNMSTYKTDYRVRSFRQSIELTEKSINKGGTI
jgi:nucleoside-diphosphate-sugar epimerase